MGVNGYDLVVNSFFPILSVVMGNVRLPFARKHDNSFIRPYAMFKVIMLAELLSSECSDFLIDLSTCRWSYRVAARTFNRFIFLNTALAIISGNQSPTRAALIF